MNRQLVSVIIPTYNRADFIRTSVESVLSQTHDNLELVVVDDGSTDATLEHLREIQDDRLKVIEQANSGVSAARNTGIAASKGGYIALLDSDDHWHPEKVARQLAFMAEGAWEISQTDEIWIRRGVRVNQKHVHAKPAGEIYAPSLKMCSVSPSCVMFTREVWERCGPFDEKLPACEDYDLWLRVALYYPVGLLHEKLTTKDGGRADQLSRKIIGLDLYRIYALLKILDHQECMGEKRSATVNVLLRKARIYVRGCLKRFRDCEAQRVTTLVEQKIGPLFA